MNLGVSPQRVGKPTTPKNVVIVVSPNITTQFKGDQYTDGWAASLMSEKQFYGRKPADDDGAVRWLSGLISAKMENRPEWTTALHEALTPLGKFSYRNTSFMAEHSFPAFEIPRFFAVFKGTQEEQEDAAADGSSE